ncbi:MAG: hypothetical protein HY835_14480 [Anaerolineae bacterium]|nr:hypothetical protein [Anaerolineae bacterium]
MICAVLLSITGAVLGIVRSPSSVLASLPAEGLATPRTHITQLAPTPKPTQGLEGKQEAAAASVQQQAAAPVSARLDSPPKAAQPGQPSIDPANQYIYNFLDSYQPQDIGGGCAAVWEMVPDYSRLPNWLTTPSQPQQLYSKISLYFLAAMLIRNNAVDATECANNGISVENPWVANNCGLSKAYAAVIEWQNRFNGVILDIAQQTGVPAQLMKNIFSRESQFWPGIFTALDEAGFGQLTVGGADVLLMWNTNFYDQFCPQVLVPEACRKGYTNLTINEQQMLTGALVRMVNATCPTCPDGVDPRLAEFSVRVFAENLIANCNQVGQIIQNEAKRPPNRTSTYEDLWLFTLVNYHAGSGCFQGAVRDTLKGNYDLNWELVASNLPDYCASAKLYVEEVIYMPEIAPNPTPPPATPTPTPAP